MLQSNFETHFPLKHAQKDVALACALGQRIGQPLPVVNLVNSVFKEAISRGFEDDNFSAVLDALKTQDGKI